MDLALTPKLRSPLELHKIADTDEEFLVIRDPESLADAPLVLPWACEAIVSRFDGSYSLAAILREGEPWGLTADILRQLVALLEENFLLESPASAARRTEIRQQFLAQPERAASHAGEVYPEDPDLLREDLEQYLSETLPPQPFPPANPETEAEVIALICPHIDYHRGWQTYANVGHILETVERPDIIFLFGTSHQPGKSLFQLTKKHFQSPLGLFQNHHPITDQLSQAYGLKRSFDDEYLHRKEHSLELQLPWLAHRYGREKLPEIVPILVGSFHHLFKRDRSPCEDPELADFLAVFAEVLTQCHDAGKSALLLGGVDLAHVGSFFGDSFELTDPKLQEVRTRDRQLLAAVLEADEEALYQHMREDLDARRVCGYPSIYTMLAGLRRAQIGLVGYPGEYRQAVDPDSGCLVSFASAYWRRSI